jgi:hypothetical protein
MSTTTRAPVRDFNEVAIASGAMTLVGALAWNTVAREVVELIVPHSGNKISQLFATIAYAVFVTIVIIVLIYSGNYAIHHNECVVNESGDKPEPTPQPSTTSS